MQVVLKWIQPWKHVESYWIHEEIQEEPSSFAQARIMLSFCIVAGALCLVTIFAGWLSKPEYIQSYGFVALGHTITCSSFVLLRYSSSMRIPSRVMMITTIIQLGQAPIWTGFYESPVLYTYPLATMFIGVVGSHVQAMITGVFLAIFAVLHWQLGLVYPTFASGGQIPLVATMVLIWCTLTAMTLAIYNRLKEQALLERIQRELRVRTQAQRETEEANIAKDFFIAYLSHEIRNPLTVIVASIEMLSLSMETKRENKYLQSLQTASGGLSSLLDDVLDFSSIQRSQLELQKVNFDLSALLEEIHQEFEGQATAKELELSLVMTGDLWVNTDRLRLKQVLVNLVSNAIKFTAEGQVQISAEKKNENIEIAVCDTGAGISLANIDAIFQPFGRERSVQAFGIGLGLAICRGLLALMGSEIRVETQVASGSRFYFSLPSVQALKENDKTPNGEETRLEGVRILIIEDNEDIVRLYSEQLCRLGCVVRTQFDGLSGLEQARRWKPDVIVLDLDIPECSGQDIIHCLHSENNPAQIIVVTGSSWTSGEWPVFCCLKKPTSLRELQQVIQNALYERSN